MFKRFGRPVLLNVYTAENTKPSRPKRIFRVHSLVAWSDIIFVGPNVRDCHYRVLLPLGTFRIDKRTA